MKKALKKALFFAVMLSLTAASGFAGGVSVGNGQREYLSPKGFSVAFADKLSLEVNSDSSFRISNEELVKEKDKVSRITFQVTENAMLDRKELREWLARQYLGMQFEYIQLPGAEGYYHETRKGDSLKGRYFLLTANRELVDINVDAHAAGRGLELITPIVFTFTYDITPPVVEKAWVENRVWPAGSKQKVFFRAADENSGVDVASINSYVARKARQKNLSTILGSNPKEEAPGLYSIEFEVNAFVSPGTFDFQGITVYDRAGNAVYWKFAQAFSVEVENRGTVDTLPPRLLEIRADNRVWRMGETYRVYFRADDLISGIERIRCGPLKSMKNYDGYSRYSDECKDLRREKNGWYSADYQLRPFIPSGEYVIDHVYVTDKAGNSFAAQACEKSDVYYCENGDVNTLSLLKVTVQNDGPVDIQAPELLDIRLGSEIWKAGETQQVFFKFKDKGGAGLHIEGSWRRGVIYPANPRNSEAHFLLLDQPMKAVGEGWYKVDVVLSPFMKAGDFYLGYFSAYDNAGNRLSLDCGHEGMPKECKKSDGSSMKPLRIRVVR